MKCILLASAFLVALVSCQPKQLKVIDNLKKDVLQDKYLALRRDMCFKYDQNVGSYLQTSDMYNINSLFTTSIDISKLGAGSVTHVTLHRNSYKSIESAVQNKLAINMIYDKSGSDDYIQQQNLDVDKDIMVRLEIFGKDGETQTSQGIVKNVDKTKVLIEIDFVKSWEAKVIIGGEIFLDLTNNYPPGQKKLEMLKTLGSNPSTADNGPNDPYNPLGVNDQGTKDAFMAYSIYASESISNPALSSKLLINSFKVGSQSIPFTKQTSSAGSVAFQAYDLPLQQIPYFLRVGNKEMTYFSKYLFNTVLDSTSGLYKAQISLYNGNLMFPNNQVNIYGDQLYSTWGTVKDMKVTAFTGPSFQFQVDQDSKQYQKSIAGILLPILPFNNRINIQIQGKALVNLQKNVQISTLTTDSDFPSNYMMSARVYIRQRNYPFTILSRDPQQKIVMTKNMQTWKFDLDLDNEAVQTDLSAYAELIFDFTDMVEQIYDSDANIQSQQKALGEWLQARIVINKVITTSLCANPIALTDIQKYENTLSALRQGTIMNTYQTISSYRVDEASEKRVKSINKAWPIMIISWIVLVTICVIKIYRYRQSIKNTNKEIEEEKKLLMENQTKVVNLRRLKLMRNEQIMQELADKQKNGQPDEDYNALQDLVGGEEENHIAIMNKVKADHVFDIPEEQEEDEYEYGSEEDRDKKE